MMLRFSKLLPGLALSLALWALIIYGIASCQRAHAGFSPVPQTCNQVASYAASTSGATQLVAAVSGQSVYVCGFVFLASSVATSVGLEYGTGSNCATGTGTASMPPSFSLPAGIPLPLWLPFWNGFVTPASKALCIVTGAGNPVQATISYAQQ